jgi:hypothetical protein
MRNLQGLFSKDSMTEVINTWRAVDAHQRNYKPNPSYDSSDCICHIKLRLSAKGITVRPRIISKRRRWAKQSGLLEERMGGGVCGRFTSFRFVRLCAKQARGDRQRAGQKSSNVWVTHRCLPSKSGSTKSLWVYTEPFFIHQSWCCDSTGQPKTGSTADASILLAYHHPRSPTRIE